MDPVRHGPLNDKTSGALATGEVSRGDQATVIKMTWKRATQQASVQQKPEKKTRRKLVSFSNFSMVDVHKMTLLGSSLFQLRKHITTTQTCRAGTGILNGSSSINKSDCEEGSFLNHVRSRAVATSVTTSLIKTPTQDVWWQRPCMTSLPNSKTHQRDAPMHQEWVNKPRFYGTNLQEC